MTGSGSREAEAGVRPQASRGAPCPAGAAPRLAPRPASEVAALAGRLEGPAAQVLAGGAGPLAGRPVLNVLATIGHHPDLLVALVPLLTQLAQGLTPPRERELAILRTAPAVPTSGTTMPASAPPPA
ncbi:hypothetical protein ACFV6D_26140 [Kitasatospora sp. NPDC059812]|uniref:hypothetical protein n=1 Tax=Kitasatospora sp. NPDC059812 TaxID=3346958 RepID=UPI00366353A7